MAAHPVGDGQDALVRDVRVLVVVPQTADIGRGAPPELHI
jgi:hypothetical protein